jgi:hypothetical protein
MVDAPYGFDKAPNGPPLVNRGTDYVEMADSLLQFDSWIEAYDPDAALIPLVAAPSSTFDRAIRSDVAELNRYDTRLYEVETGRLEIRIADSSKEDVVTLTVVQHVSSQRLVDRSGRVVSERKFPSPATTYTVLLVELKDGRWALADIEERSAQ